MSKRTPSNDKLLDYTVVGFMIIMVWLWGPVYLIGWLGSMSWEWVRSRATAEER